MGGDFGGGLVGDVRLREVGRGPLDAARRGAAAEAEAEAGARARFFNLAPEGWPVLRFMAKVAQTGGPIGLFSAPFPGWPTSQQLN